MPQLMEVLEFLDNSGNTMVKRVPENDKTEIKSGAQLTVRESQKAIFFKDGKATEIFDPGRYVLNTKNFPVLTKLVTSIGYGSDSPFRAEVYFLNMKLFRNLKWGTAQPITLSDSLHGTIRLKAFGFYSIKINEENPKLFLNYIVGTQGYFRDSEISDYLKNLILSKINTVLGTFYDTFLNLVKKFDFFEEKIKNTLVNDFTNIGLVLEDFHFGSISFPPDVEKAIDTKTGMSIIGDLNDFLKYKVAQAIEKSAENNAGTSEGLGTGIGFGAGMIMPKIIQESLEKNKSRKEGSLEKIKKLKELLDINAITQEEFENTKNELLKNL
ncbi:SPFH domain-containing protein [Flavobacterium sp.]|uniref:SPFH domain-containing protein n=1 Tax=Flavobacterium sp. TaxID=239 RepID=UPI00374D8F32